MTTIAELLQPPRDANGNPTDGIPVIGLQCSIMFVGKRRTGEGQYGPWSVLPLTATDPTGKIPVQWWDAPAGAEQLPLGTFVTISAAKNLKGQLAGAATKLYQGAIQLAVKADHLLVAADHNVNYPAGLQAPGPAAAPQPPPGATARPVGGGQRVNLPGASTPTLGQCLELARKAHFQLAECLVDSSGGPENAVIGPMVSTLLIAYTNGRVIYDPKENLAPPSAPPQQRQSAPPPPTDDDIPF